jgi:hypothetical protein
MSLFSKDPYQHIVDFIVAVVGSDDLTKLIHNLEKKPIHLRLLELAEIKSQMLANHEPEKFTEVVELLNNPEILSATNKVINDVRNSGMDSDQYFNKKDRDNYKALTSLISATF